MAVGTLDRRSSPAGLWGRGAQLVRSWLRWLLWGPADLMERSGFQRADRFFMELMLTKVAWIAGLMGGGKTTLAYALAYELIERGYVDGAVCNFPTDLKLPDWRKNLLRRVVQVLDESHLFVDNRRSMLNDKGYGAMGRKLGNYLILPSVYPVDVRLRALQIQRSNRLIVPGLRSLIQLVRKLPILGWLLRLTPLDWFGSEIWVYQYDLNLGYIAGKGSFWVVRPERYFNHFDTRYIPTSDGGILDLFSMTCADEALADVGEGSFFVPEEDLTDDERNALRAQREKYLAQPGGASEEDGDASLDFSTFGAKIRTSSRTLGGEEIEG